MDNFENMLSEYARLVVKVGVNLQQDQRLVFDLQGTDKAITLVVKHKIGRSRESVQYSKSYVVAGAGILVADVAQPHNQVIHL